MSSKLWDFSLLKAKILNHTDTRISSNSYGCVDRRYWAWKLTDFPDLTLQYAVYPFGLLLDESSSREKEIYRAMVLFWVRNVRADGSVDQCFINEKSIGPTLYSLHGVLSSLENHKCLFSNDELSLLKEVIVATLDFSAKNPERYGHVANHKALFAHAFILGARFTDEPRFLSCARKELDELMGHYTEGWFLEYETADPGYQTQCLHYLLLSARALNDNRLLHMIDSSIESFLSYFVFPDGSFAGVFGGRATELLYPCSFFILQESNGAAKGVVKHLLEDNDGENLVKWYALDFENFIRLGTNWLLCQDMFHPRSTISTDFHLPCKREFVKFFEKSGIYVRSTREYYFITNCKRGGMFKLVSKSNGEVLEDSGYLLSGESKAVTSIYNNGSDVLIEDLGCRIGTVFFRLGSNFLSPIKLIGLRMLGLTFFRIGFFNFLVKKMMIQVLLKTKRKVKVDFNRKFDFGDHELTVTDTIVGSEDGMLISLGRDVPFHMASSGYWHKQNDTCLKKWSIKKPFSRSAKHIRRILINNSIRVQDSSKNEDSKESI